MSAVLAHLYASGDNNNNQGQDRTISRYEEPLKRFADAKNQIKDIYNDLEGCVQNLAHFYDDGSDTNKCVPEKEIAEVQRFQDSIATIQKMFNRDKMKVVFFGRTSNGKSTVINAMLHQKLLPQGIGHTTSSFLKVEGGSDNEKLLQIEGSDKKLPITDLHRLGNALSATDGSTKIGTDSLITVLYPKASSKLLQNDVVLVDSPGVDLSQESDCWIDKHCLDADVFVLVCNSESTLTQAEKNFFLRVSKKLSRPNVFILNNRWDASASEAEEQIKQVRNQHMKRFMHFLVDELKSCSLHECKDRIFFISAREVLEERMKERGELANAYQQEGHDQRRNDFNDFEANFEQIISKAAIKTKFEAHAHRANEIINDMKDNLDNVINFARQEKQRLKLDYELKNRELNECQKQFSEFEQNYREQLRRIRKEIRLKVSTDFDLEIERLESIIDRFNEPGEFYDSPERITNYKARLARYVEKCVTENLEDKCSGALISRIWNLEQELYENVANIIGVEYAKNLEALWKYKHPFKFTITVDVPHFAHDFKEDLEFRFSLGFTCLFQKILFLITGRPMALFRRHAINRQQFNNQPNLDQMANLNMNPRGLTDKLMGTVEYALSYADRMVGFIIVGFCVYHKFYWKLIAGGGVYGSLYIIERFRWNNAAKEERLKNQFRSHLAFKMKQIGNVYTAQCENQVINELENVHNGLCDVMGGVQQQMKSDIDTIVKGVTRIEEFLKGIISIKNKTTFLNTSLEEFAIKFLAPDSP